MSTPLNGYNYVLDAFLHDSSRFYKVRLTSDSNYGSGIVLRDPCVSSSLVLCAPLVLYVSQRVNSIVEHSASTNSTPKWQIVVATSLVAGKTSSFFPDFPGRRVPPVDGATEGG